MGTFLTLVNLQRVPRTVQLGLVRDAVPANSAERERDLYFLWLQVRITEP